MTGLSEEKVRKFVDMFIKTLQEKVSTYSRFIEPKLIFPDYLIHPYYIVVIIGNDGVVIEFLEKRDRWEMEIRRVGTSIEKVIFPEMNGKLETLFEVKGKSIVIESINLFHLNFYQKYADILSCFARSIPNIIGDMSSFIKLHEGADIKVIDVGIGCVDIYGNKVIKRFPFLWLIKTKSEDFFDEGNAKFHAEQEFNRYLKGEKVIRDLLQKGIVDRVLGLVGTLLEFEKLVHKENVSENEIQEFLEQNPCLLYIEYKNLFPKFRIPDIKKDLYPDFIVETPDGKYIVVEIESPTKKLFTKNLCESKELREAKAQIENYLDKIRENILILRQQLPNISVNNVEGRLIIGLSSKMSNEEKRRLKSLNEKLRGYEIITYTELIENWKQLLKNLGIPNI